MSVRCTQKRRLRIQRRRRDGPAVTQLSTRHPRPTKPTHGGSAVRYCQESAPCSLIHIQSDTPYFSTSLLFRMHDCCFHDRRRHERAFVHFSVTLSLRLKFEVSGSVSPRLCTAGTPVFVWAKCKIRVPPHTTETGRQQNSASPASDVPAKLETQCRAARTPSREEFKTC